MPQPHHPGEQPSARWVRPYVHTQGRTHPSQTLPIEALVTTQPHAELPRQGRRNNYHVITRLCHTPHSVAEVAAHLAIPLGTARILIADLAEWRVVRVQTTPLAHGDRPSLNLLERVLRGLHNL